MPLSFAFVVAAHSQAFPKPALPIPPPPRPVFTRDQVKAALATIGLTAYLTLPGILSVESRDVLFIHFARTRPFAVIDNDIVNWSTLDELVQAISSRK